MDSIWTHLTPQPGDKTFVRGCLTESKVNLVIAVMFISQKWKLKEALFWQEQGTATWGEKQWIFPLQIYSSCKSNSTESQDFWDSLSTKRTVVLKNHFCAMDAHRLETAVISCWFRLKSEMNELIMEQIHLKTRLKTKQKSWVKRQGSHYKSHGIGQQRLLVWAIMRPCQPLQNSWHGGPTSSHMSGFEAMISNCHSLSLPSGIGIWYVKVEKGKPTVW